MGLLDEVREESRPKRRTKLDEIREKLNDEDYAEFREAMLDTTISQMSLVRALAKRKVHIGAGTLSELRRAMIRGEA